MASRPWISRFALQCRESSSDCVEETTSEGYGSPISRPSGAQSQSVSMQAVIREPRIAVLVFTTLVYAKCGRRQEYADDPPLSLTLRLVQDFFSGGVDLKLKATLHEMALKKSGNSLSAKFRDARNLELLRRFPSIASMTVLDLGGTRSWWEQLPFSPRHVTVVNLDTETASDSRVTSIEADACSSDLRDLGVFDLVFSNSLLEHVGGYSRRRDLAANILSMAPNHWVQTPYRYFPLEPHWVFPGHQFLPLATRARLSEKWHWGHMQSGTFEEALEDCLSTELVSKTELRHLFPGSAIWHERIVGLTKSLVAIGTRRSLDSH